MASKKQAVVIERRFWTPLRILSTILVFALLAAFGITSCNSTEGPPTSTATTPARPSSSGVMLPLNVLQAELKSANGNPIRLSDYSGKVLIVNLWATWCGPCRLEIPELVKLHKDYQQQGLEIVGLSTENPDTSTQKVQEFVRTFNMDYPVGWATPQVSMSLMRGNGAIPQSFLVGRDGRILRRFVGYSHQVTPPELRRAVEAALKG